MSNTAHAAARRGTTVSLHRQLLMEQQRARRNERIAHAYARRMDALEREVERVEEAVRGMRATIEAERQRSEEDGKEDGQSHTD